MLLSGPWLVGWLLHRPRRSFELRVARTPCLGQRIEIVFAKLGVRQMICCHGQSLECSEMYFAHGLEITNGKSETEKRSPMVVADGCNWLAGMCLVDGYNRPARPNLPKLQCDDLVCDGHNRRLVSYVGMIQIDNEPTKSTPV